MKLSELLENAKAQFDISHGNDEITEIIYDSRTESPDKSGLFICIKGFAFDSHDHAMKMYSRGIRHFVAEHTLDLPSDAVVAVCESTRRALAVISAAFFGYPAKKLCTVALTGTKGKTSTSFMIKNILEEDNKKVGVIGTMGVFFKDKHYSTVNTTPESYDIQNYLNEMVNDGVEYLVMEVSSQALKVGRVDGMLFDYGIFTNLSEDHIGENEHKDMEEYIYCKSLLFKMCKNGIFNIDDTYYNNMIKNSTCNIYTFGHNKEASLVIDKVELLRKEHFIGLEMTTSGIVNDKFLVNTPGGFSAYNSACAILTTSLLGCNINSIKNALSQVAVRGRVEIVPVSNKYTVIIDYAHNGVSTESILTTMRKYNPKRIVSLFGCGGNRSKDRRYDMGEVSGKYADLSIITEDNSRYEDVNDIMNDIEVGIKKTNGKYIKIPDRREAIKYAIDNAKEGDIILILGKGHETYQEKNGERTHFDDREEVLKLFK